MRAVLVRAYGGAEAMDLVEVDTPEAGVDEVLIRVHAAGVNDVDNYFREGYLETGPLPIVLGCDVAGVVEALGPGVSGFAVGDRVFGYKYLGNGTYADHAVLPAAELAPMPGSLGFEQAAALPCAGLIAFDTLANTLRVQPGELVLIGAGSGGVGHLAVQIAKALGATVIATASATKADFVRSLGADHVVEHGTPDLAERVLAIAPQGVDAALATVPAIEQDAVAATRSGGRLTWINDENGPPLERDIRGRYTGWSRGTALLQELAALVEEGGIHTIAIERAYPLEQFREALAASRAAHVTGKLVISLT